MRRRDALQLLAGGLTTASVIPASTSAHPTPSETAGDGTPRPTRTDSGYSPLGRVDVEGATETVVSADGTTAYVAVTTGYAIVDVSQPSDPTVLAEQRELLTGHEDGPLEGIHDVKQDGDTMLVVGPANGAPDPYLSGLLVVDVSNPAAPERRAFYETDYPIHNCYLDGDRAYLTANGQAQVRLDILDIGSEEPTRIGDWQLTEYEEAWVDVAAPLRVLHDVWVQDDVAYLAHWDAGTWLLDVSDPGAPTILTHIGRSAEEVLEDAGSRRRSEQLSVPGNSHFVTIDDDADLLAVGREAWASRRAPPDDEETDTATDAETSDETETASGGGGPGGIDLFDISDPVSPEKLVTIGPPPTVDPTINGDWTTAHNCELRNGVLYSSWYRGGVKRHDVSDPERPVELTWWADPPHAEFWTARVGVTNTTFVASSRGTANSSAGLYVFPDKPGTTTWGFEDRVGETPTPTESQASTPTATATATSVPTSTPATGTTPADAPGFGLLAGLSGIGAVALIRALRED